MLLTMCKVNLTMKSKEKSQNARYDSWKTPLSVIQEKVHFP
jgi:hypothetical protein